MNNYKCSFVILLLFPISLIWLNNYFFGWKIKYLYLIKIYLYLLCESERYVISSFIIDLHFIQQINNFITKNIYNNRNIYYKFLLLQNDVANNGF